MTSKTYEVNIPEMKRRKRCGCCALVRFFLTVVAILSISVLGAFYAFNMIWTPFRALPGCQQPVLDPFAKSDWTPGCNSMMVECINGHEMEGYPSGRMTSECVLNKEWSPQPPACITLPIRLDCDVNQGGISGTLSMWQESRASPTYVYGFLSTAHVPKVLTYLTENIKLSRATCRVSSVTNVAMPKPIPLYQLTEEVEIRFETRRVLAYKDVDLHLTIVYVDNPKKLTRSVASLHQGDETVIMDTPPGWPFGIVQKEEDGHEIAIADHGRTAVVESPESTQPVTEQPVEIAAQSPATEGSDAKKAKDAVDVPKSKTPDAEVQSEQPATPDVIPVDVTVTAEDKSVETGSDEMKESGDDTTKPQKATPDVIPVEGTVTTGQDKAAEMGSDEKKKASNDKLKPQKEVPGQPPKVTEPSPASKLAEAEMVVEGTEISTDAKKTAEATVPIEKAITPSTETENVQEKPEECSGAETKTETKPPTEANRDGDEFAELISANKIEESEKMLKARSNQAPEVALKQSKDPIIPASNITTPDAQSIPDTASIEKDSGSVTPEPNVGSELATHHSLHDVEDKMTQEAATESKAGAGEKDATVDQSKEALSQKPLGIKTARVETDLASNALKVKDTTATMSKVEQKMATSEGKKSASEATQQKQQSKPTVTKAVGQDNTEVQESDQNSETDKARTDAAHGYLYNLLHRLFAFVLS